MLRIYWSHAKLNYICIHSLFSRDCLSTESNFVNILLTTNAGCMKLQLSLSLNGCCLPLDLFQNSEKGQTYNILNKPHHAGKWIICSSRVNQTFCLCWTNKSVESFFDVFLRFFVYCFVYSIHNYTLVVVK